MEQHRITPRERSRSSTPAGPRATSILIVDDEPSVRSALERAFASWGYEVSTAPSGEVALERIGERPFDLLLCDHRMPGLTGADTVRAALERRADLAAVMLTGIADVRLATEVLGIGALDFVTKPFDLDELRASAERALKKQRLRNEQRRVEALVREEVVHRTQELEAEKATLRTLTVGIAETLINAMEAKDVYLRGHSQRVADLAATIASAMRLDDDEVERVRLAGRLHDVGKIGIREDVLNKPGKLTAAEFDHIKDHVRIGMEILAPLRHLGVVLDYVHDHHEHLDGRGYPRGKRASEISLGGRILAVADTYDALTSRRAYRDAVSTEATLELMGTLAGTQLDPDAFRALVVVSRRRRTLTFIDAHALPEE